jgi:hypothetical protein
MIIFLPTRGGVPIDLTAAGPSVAAVKRQPAVSVARVEQVPHAVAHDVEREGGNG